jgi:hypothetical protein
MNPFDPPSGEDDDALILWMLSLTPTQRLQVAQDYADKLLAIRRERGDGPGEGYGDGVMRFNSLKPPAPD